MSYGLALTSKGLCSYLPSCADFISGGLLWTNKSYSRLGEYRLLIDNNIYNTLIYLIFSYVTPIEVMVTLDSTIETESTYETPISVIVYTRIGARK